MGRKSEAVIQFGPQVRILDFFCLFLLFFNQYISMSSLQLVLTGLSQRHKHPSQKSKFQMSPLIFYHSLNRKATNDIDVAWIIIFSQLKRRKRGCYLIYKSIYMEEEKYL